MGPNLRRVSLRAATWLLFCAVTVSTRLARADDLDLSGRLKLVLISAPVPRALSPDDAAKLRELVESALYASGKFVMLGRTEATALNEADRQRVAQCHHDMDCIGAVWVPHGADAIARLEVSWPRGHMLLTLVAKRLPSGNELARAEEPVQAGGSLVVAADGLAHSLANAAGGLPPSPAPLPSDEKQLMAPAATRPRAKSAPDRWSEKLPTTDLPSPEKRRVGLMAGIEIGGGPWNASPLQIIAGSKNGFDFTHYASAFSATIDQQWHAAMDLHIGWNFLGFGAVEAALQTSGWNAGSPSSGGAVLAGVRATLLPVEFFLPDRNWDVGVELGGGYALVGASGYDMDGSYFTFGLTGEYYLTPAFSIGGFYRLFTPFLTRFFIDYATKLSEPVTGFTAYWNTLGVDATWHIPVSL
jgi:hypothetical protein